MSNPHYEPEAASSLPIRKGDAVLIDMWAKLDRPGAVYYDITWTGYCGATAPEDMQNVFAVVTGARDRAIQRITDAVARNETIRGFEVDDAARDPCAAIERRRASRWREWRDRECVPEGRANIPTCARPPRLRSGTSAAVRSR